MIFFNTDELLYCWKSCPVCDLNKDSEPTEELVTSAHINGFLSVDDYVDDLENESFDVEKILQMAVSDGVTKFLIKWRGYGE